MSVQLLGLEHREVKMILDMHTNSAKTTRIFTASQGTKYN